MDTAAAIFVGGIVILIAAAFLGVPSEYFYVVGGVFGFLGFSRMFD
jgi:hypothetical protein